MAAAGVAGPGEEDFGQKVVHMFAKQLSNVGFTNLSKGMFEHVARLHYHA